MGDLKLNCTLCCNKSFDSKQLLVQHLSTVLDNLYCPICNNRWTSLAHLIEHLSVDICLPDLSVATGQSIIFDNNCAVANGPANPVLNVEVTQSVNNLEDNSITTLPSEVSTVEAGNRLYVEFFDNKDGLQGQSLKLLPDENGGEGQYVIVSENTTGLGDSDTLVASQSQDGTLTLRDAKDVKAGTFKDQQTQPMETQEVYSCNTCGVSFTSVMEHIQLYHNDQEVVVEEPIHAVKETGANNEISIEYDPLDDEDYIIPNDQIEATIPIVPEKITAHRVITETGDIVEAHYIPHSNSDQIKDSKQPKETNKSKSNSPNENTKQSKRFEKVADLCDRVVTKLKPDDKSGPYHRVVVKEIVTTSGNTVKMYHCMACDIYVTDLNEFKLHPCTTSKYVCSQCPMAYDNSKSLCAHMKVHKARPDKDEIPSYSCNICKTVFPTNKSLKLHKRMHEPVKARPVDPPTSQTKKVEEEHYLCTVCQKLIPVLYRVEHQNSHKPMINCTICNKKFTSQEYLDMHMSVHNIDKAPTKAQNQSLPYCCKYCERRFSRPHEKVKHERIHTGERPHSCEICGKTFRVSYCLTLHMRTHTGARPYACPHCGKRFKAHSVYNHHLMTHSEVRAYKCPYCPKAFKTSVQLAGHKNSHTKPFSCQTCNRPFASLYAVRVHTETHARQNNLKFVCKLCGASYARTFALRDHMKQQHKPEEEAEADDDDMGKHSKEDDTNNKEDDWLNKEMNDLEMGISSSELTTQ